MSEDVTLNELQNSLEETIGAEKILEITGEVSEALIDSLLQSEILKNIPFFGTFYKAGQIALAVKDRIFAKKVLKFLIGIKDIDSKDRIKFIEELENETGQKAGEVLIMLLDRLDNMGKPRIIANLLKAKICGHITIEDFLKIAYIIDKAYLPDLQKLEGYYNMRGYPKGLYLKEVSESLYNLGLLDITYKAVKDDKSLFAKSMWGGSNDRYKINRIGCAIFEHGIKG